MDTLNISCNGLDSLAGLSAVPSLATLVAERNNLGGAGALDELLTCPNLHTLDLQHCGIEDTGLLQTVFAQMQGLRCLYLKGNPFVSALPHYRKAVIASCTALTYLDERPVTDEERLCCEAWCAWVSLCQTGWLCLQPQQCHKHAPHTTHMDPHPFRSPPAVVQGTWRAGRRAHRASADHGGGCCAR